MSGRTDNTDFTSYSTVFQSYQDDGKVIIKVCVQWNPVYAWKDFRLQRGSNPWPLDHAEGRRLEYSATGAPTLSGKYPIKDDRQLGGTPSQYCLFNRRI